MSFLKSTPGASSCSSSVGAMLKKCARFASWEKKQQKLKTDSGEQEWCLCDLRRLLNRYGVEIDLQHDKQGADYPDPAGVDIVEPKLGMFVDSLFRDEKSLTERIAVPQWNCSECLSSPPVEAVTLACGHVHCRKCTDKKSENSWRCSKCGTITQSCGLRTNVLAKKTCHKYFLSPDASKVSAIEAKTRGNEKFSEDKMEEAASEYSAALELAPDDHLLWGSRSHAYLNLGNPLLALSDASAACALRPSWSKGHYRRALALQALGRHEEAFLSFYECQLLTHRSVRQEMIQALRYVLIDSSLVDRFQQEEPEPHASPMSDDEISDDNSSSSNDSTSVDTLPPEVAKKSQPPSRLCRLPKRAANVKRELLRQCVEHRDPDPFRSLEESQADPQDFECPLCFRLLFVPTTTPCGHTFCRACLDRSIDHTPNCPLCKLSLAEYVAEKHINGNQSSDEFVSACLQRLLSEASEVRRLQHEKELAELSLAEEIPVFVCTMGFPRIPCPLHVFEPRYRLMIRRCIETGTRRFGMCCAIDETVPFADFGTMLEIRDIQYFPDGRAVVDTVGERRFRVLQRGVCDGYHTAKVEFVTDDPVPCDNIQELQSLHDVTLSEAQEWFQSMSPGIRQGILSHYGPLPQPETDYWEQPNGPSWAWWILAILPLDPKAQLQILSQTALNKRLDAMQRILRYLSRKAQ